MKVFVYLSLEFMIYECKSIPKSGKYSTVSLHNICAALSKYMRKYYRYYLSLKIVIFKNTFMLPECVYFA